MISNTEHLMRLIFIFLRRLRDIYVPSIKQILSPAFSKSNNAYEPILIFRELF